MDFLADTTFLIDLQRQTPSAIRFLEEHSQDTFRVSIISVGELVPGFVGKGPEALRAFLEPFPIMMIDQQVTWRYGESYLALKKKSALIGSNDLWIGATASVHNLTILSRNVDHFARLDRVQVQGY